MTHNLIQAARWAVTMLPAPGGKGQRQPVTFPHTWVLTLVKGKDVSYILVNSMVRNDLPKL